MITKNENQNIEFKQSWGRGIERIVEESKKFNGITPKFRYDGGLWVEFYFKTQDKNLGNRVG
jgi:ATP-dependent DNA helicase RecG